MNNRIYIAGRITGDPNYTEKFNSAVKTVKQWWFFERHGVKAALRLGRFGFDVVNPVEFTLFGRTLDKYSWTVCMIVCLFRLVRCSYVYMLHDWHESKGATLEHKAAKFLRKQIIYQNECK